MYVCFVYMHACVVCVYLVLMEARRGIRTLELEVQMVSCEP